MAKPKGARNRNRLPKHPRGRMTLAQRKRRLEERGSSDSKKAEGNTSTTDNFFKKEMVNRCSAFGCNEQFKIGSNIGFFKFPTDEIRRDLWIRAVKQMNWSPSFASVLCGKHFLTGKPSKSPAHPDYIPNIFVMDSVAKHQSHSTTVQIEESQCVIHDSSEIEDLHFDQQSSTSFTDINEGRPSKDSDYPAVVPNLSGFTNSVEKHPGHSGTAQTEESQCVIYDKIEIEHIPIDPELLSSSIDASEAFTSGIKSKVLRRIGTEVEQQSTIGDVIKNESDGSLILNEGEIVCESSRPKEGEISVLKLKLNKAHNNVNTLRGKKVDILKKLKISSAQQKILERYVTEKEKELSKLRKKLQGAYKEISCLRSERIAWQNCSADRIRDRIFQDASKLRFFTGLNSIKDFLLLAELLYDVDTTGTSVSVSSQLLIVLMRLQLNLKYPDLADRFRTSINTIKMICEILIPHLESKLKLFQPTGLSPITVGMQPNVGIDKHSHAIKYGYKTNAVFVKLYRTIQRYTKSV